MELTKMNQIVDYMEKGFPINFDKVLSLALHNRLNSLFVTCRS